MKLGRKSGESAVTEKWARNPKFLLKTGSLAPLYLLIGSERMEYGLRGQKKAKSQTKISEQKRARVLRCS